MDLPEALIELLQELVCELVHGMLLRIEDHRVPERLTDILREILRCRVFGTCELLPDRPEIHRMFDDIEIRRDVQLRGIHRRTEPMDIRLLHEPLQEIETGLEFRGELGSSGFPASASGLRGPSPEGSDIGIFIRFLLVVILLQTATLQSSAPLRTAGGWSLRDTAAAAGGSRSRGPLRRASALLLCSFGLRGPEQFQTALQEGDPGFRVHTAERISCRGGGRGG